MADGQGLALGAEEHLLMRHESAKPDTMYPDPLDLGAASPGQLLDRCIGRRSQSGCMTCSGNPACRIRCSTGRRIGLAWMMQLNDFRTFVEHGGLLCKTHHQYRSDGEVGCHEDPDTVVFSKFGA